MKKTDSDLLYFYQGKHFISLNQGDKHHSILRCPDIPLADLQSSGEDQTTRILVTDDKNSVLNMQNSTNKKPLTYTPYGYLSNPRLDRWLLGFNGEREDPVSGCYLLGNGYRSFSPALMRFLSPDSWSPFGEGGFNTYGYCAGDPVNRHDPTGHKMAPSLRFRTSALGSPGSAQQRVLTALQQRTPQPDQAGRQRRAQMRVQRLRQRLAQQPGATDQQRPTVQGRAFINPLAQPGGATRYADGVGQGIGNAAAANNPGNVQAIRSTPSSITLEAASTLYTELETAHRHITTYERNQQWLTPGTVADDYQAVIIRIRGRTNEIRRQLGVDNLQWFHF